MTRNAKNNGNTGNKTTVRNQTAKVKRTTPKTTTNSIAGTTGTMSVTEAGRKGGNATLALHGNSFYVNIGRVGGQRVKALIEHAKRSGF